MDSRVYKLEELITKLKSNNKINPLKIECLEWELKALKAKDLLKEVHSMCNKKQFPTEQELKEMAEKTKEYIIK